MSEVSGIIEKLLEKRGIVGEAAIRSFFEPELSALAAPSDLPGVTEAVEVIAAAMTKPGKVVVFGDYDCDGVSATAILVRALRVWDVPAAVVPFIPDRLTEGYGMNALSVGRLLREHPDATLILTVDNGINSVAEVELLRNRGIAVVVTDHHLPGETLPAADALVDPKVSAPPELAELCGAGVAFLMASALTEAAQRKGYHRGGKISGPLLVLAGLATVTDIMPLTGQNRILVANALKYFPVLAPVGLKELHLRAARSASDRLVAKDFGFLIGPRINAAGRLHSATEALELMLCDDAGRETARNLAVRIDSYNLERKAIEQKMTEEAMHLVVPGAAAQVIDLPEGHPGVAGIVASRVLEKLVRDPALTVGPVCVIAGGHGSARAPAGVNIRDAMVACSEVLDRFGGHAAAGGFSVKPGKTGEFRTRLCAYCAALPDSVRENAGAIEADLELTASELTLELAGEVLRMEPFGEGNPEPVFVFRHAQIKNVRPLGAEGRHLGLVVNGFKAVWWNHGPEAEEIRENAQFEPSVYFTVGISDYGERHVEIYLCDIHA